MATPKSAPVKPTPKPKAKVRKPKPKATSASVGMFAPHPDPSMNPMGAGGAGAGYLPTPKAPLSPTSPQGSTSVPGQALPASTAGPAHPDAALLDIIHAAIASHRATVK